MLLPIALHLISFRYRARALTLLPLCANGGMLLGPLIGGLLSSQPGMNIMSSYPYLLPNLCIAMLYFISAIGVIFGLEETLSTYNQEDNATRRARGWLRGVTSGWNGLQDFHYSAVSTVPPTVPATAHPPDTGATQSMDLDEDASTPSSHRIWTFNVFCTMTAHFIISGHLGTFPTLWTVFLSTPIERQVEGTDRHSPVRFGGGLGMQPRNVGIIMSVLGAIIVFLQVIIYPKLSDRHGTLVIWGLALYAFPVAYFCAPFPALIASGNSSSGPFKPEWLAVAGVLVVFGIGRTGVTPATTMLINDCSPHPSVRATIHSTATVLGNLSRSIFPVTALAIFGMGLKIGAVGLAFWCLTGLALLSCVASRFVRGGSRDDT